MASSSWGGAPMYAVGNRVGADVLLLEKTGGIGSKLRITGKGHAT